LETLSSSIERIPVTPREPSTIVAVSCRSAIATIAFHGAAGLDSQRFGMHAGLPCDTNTFFGDASAVLGG
jgi:hypothetical protein